MLPRLKATYLVGFEKYIDPHDFSDGMGTVSNVDTRKESTCVQTVPTLLFLSLVISLVYLASEIQSNVASKSCQAIRVRGPELAYSVLIRVQWLFQKSRDRPSLDPTSNPSHPKNQTRLTPHSATWNSSSILARD